MFSNVFEVCILSDYVNELPLYQEPFPAFQKWGVKLNDANSSKIMFLLDLTVDYKDQYYKNGNIKQ